MKDYEEMLLSQGIQREQWDGFKAADVNAPREDSLVIKEELKGLWIIDGRDCIVEGECPVRYESLLIMGSEYSCMCRCAGNQYRVVSLHQSQVSAVRSHFLYE